MLYYLIFPGKWCHPDMGEFPAVSIRVSSKKNLAMSRSKSSRSNSGNQPSMLHDAPDMLYYYIYILLYKCDGTYRKG
jgi:hypothetical protein